MCKSTLFISNDQGFLLKKCQKAKKMHENLHISKNSRTFAAAKQGRPVNWFDLYRGVEQLVARQAHNLEVACSSPASATTEVRFYRTFFVFYGKTLHMLPVAVLRRAKRPFGPSASPASATQKPDENRASFVLYPFTFCRRSRRLHRSHRRLRDLLRSHRHHRVLHGCHGLHPRLRRSRHDLGCYLRRS